MAGSPATEAPAAGRPPGPATAVALAAVERLAGLARESDRSDLLERLREVRTRLEADSVAVAVLGEFKQGKSTLVNALLRTDVCPVDPDVGTAVPTVVRYGTPPRAVGHAGRPGESDPVPLDVRGLADSVTERQRGDEPRLRTVEVFLDRALLGRGLSLVDTPGLGGIESEHGVAALEVLPVVQAALFVTDASSELTAPELAFLTSIVARCSTVLCVVTKTDLHADWRRVVDLDRGHLARAGLDVPVVAVSSFLRMRAAARGDASLHESSGFPALLEALGSRVLRRADALAAASARTDLLFVQEQLRQQVAAEREVLRRRPDESQQLVTSLAAAATRARALTSESATWQLVLGDGISDLAADVEHDLRQRLLALLRAGEAMLDAGDPRQMWPEFNAWLRAEAAKAAVDNVQVMVHRAEQLAREVSERFDLDVETLDVDLPVPALALGRVTELRVDFARSPSRRLLGLLTAARVSYTGGVMGGAAGGVLATMAGMSTVLLTVSLAPITAGAAALFARRILGDDRTRELELLRQQAKQELRRYVDEVGFVVGKESRDAVRRTQRYLRDEFGARAALVQHSADASLAAARSSTRLPPERRAVRARQLERQWRLLEAGRGGDEQAST